MLLVEVVAELQARLRIARLLQYTCLTVFPHSGMLTWKAKSTAMQSRAVNQARAQHECSRADVMMAGYLRGSHTATYLSREVTGERERGKTACQS